MEEKRKVLLDANSFLFTSNNENLDRKIDSLLENLSISIDELSIFVNDGFSKETKLKVKKRFDYFYDNYDVNLVNKTKDHIYKMWSENNDYMVASDCKTLLNRLTGDHYDFYYQRNSIVHCYNVVSNKKKYRLKQKNIDPNVFRSGKYKGHTHQEVFFNDPDYIKWMISKDYKFSTKKEKKSFDEFTKDLSFDEFNKK